MKHLDKQLEANVSLYEKNGESTPKQIENYLLTLLVIIGLVGALYLFSTAFKNPGRHSGSGLTTHVPDSPKEKAVPATAKQPAVPAEPQLIITGPKDAEELLFFTITQFDERKQYELHLGNGMTIYPNDKVTRYRFPASGTYNIKLMVKDQEVVSTVHREKLRIQDAITVAPGAMQER